MAFLVDLGSFSQLNPMHLSGFAHIYWCDFPSVQPSFPLVTIIFLYNVFPSVSFRHVSFFVWQAMYHVRYEEFNPSSVSFRGKCITKNILCCWWSCLQKYHKHKFILDSRGKIVDHALPFRQTQLVVINNFDFSNEQFEVLARFFLMFKNLCMAFVHL